MMAATRSRRSDPIILRERAPAAWRRGVKAPYVGGRDRHQPPMAEEGREVLLRPSVTTRTERRPFVV